MNSAPKNIWVKCLIKPNSKIKEVVRSLSKSSLQICLVISKNRTLIFDYFTPRTYIYMFDEYHRFDK